MNESLSGGGESALKRVIFQKWGVVKCIILRAIHYKYNIILFVKNITLLNLL